MFISSDNLFITPSYGSEKINNINLSELINSHDENYNYAIMGDRSIEEFLGNFINNMVENVRMMVDFIINLLRDSLGGN